MEPRESATCLIPVSSGAGPIITAEQTAAELGQLLDLLDALPRLGDPRELLSQLVLTMRNAPQRISVLLNLDDAGHWSINPLTPSSLPPVLTPEISDLATRLAKTPEPKCFDDLDGAFRCAIAAPLFVGGRVTDWVLVLDQQAQGLGLEDLQELIVRTRLVAMAAEQLQITRELCAANLRVQEEIQQVASVQRALLPQGLPRIQGLDVTAWYSPVVHAGGDFYDFVRLSRRHGPNDPWAILVGDVSGHGPGAAVVMAMINAMLHTAPLEGAGPGDLLAHVNDHLCSKGFAGTFATAFLCVFDPASRRLTYACAGHPPALLITPGRSVAPLDAAGDVPLGIASGQAFTEAQLVLAPGQTVLFYTDGITEAANAAGEFFHQSRLQDAIFNAATAEAALMAARMALTRHVGGLDQNDDQTLVAIAALDPLS